MLAILIICNNLFCAHFIKVFTTQSVLYNEKSSYPNIKISIRPLLLPNNKKFNKTLYFVCPHGFT